MPKRKHVKNDTGEGTSKKQNSKPDKPENKVIDPETVKKMINMTFDKSKELLNDILKDKERQDREIAALNVQNQELKDENVKLKDNLRKVENALVWLDWSTTPRKQVGGRPDKTKRKRIEEMVEEIRNKHEDEEEGLDFDF